METPRKFKLLHRHRTLTRAAIKIGQSFAILCNDEHEPIQKMNGDEYVDILMEEPERCLKMLRMYPDAFIKLHGDLIRDHNLQAIGNTTSRVALAMFLYHCAHGATYTMVGDRFEKCKEVVSSCINNVADVMCNFGHAMVGRLEGHGDINCVHPEFKDAPLFQGCYGVMDGTHIPVKVHEFKERYRDRDNNITVSILIVADMNRRIIFLGTGFVASLNDADVLRDCQQEPNFPHPPRGMYHLGDSGYDLEVGYLTPYKDCKYGLFESVFHKLKVRKDNPIIEKHKAFNTAHAKKRVIVEHVIGLLKQRWKILKQGKKHDPIMINKIIAGVCGLHNFLWEYNYGRDVIETYPMTGWARAHVENGIEAPDMQELICEKLSNNQGGLEEDDFGDL